MPVKSLDIERRLKELGFKIKSQKGSHRKFINNTGKTLNIPNHKAVDVKMGIIWNINRNLKSWGYEQLNLWN